MSVEKEFHAAVEYIRSLPPSGRVKPSNAMKLKFYSCFKQATDGPVKGKQPSRLYFVARAKWDAWKELGDMNSEAAMQTYIAELAKLNPDWAKGTDAGVEVGASKLEQELGSNVHIGDEEALTAKIQKIKELGAKNLQVVADFDFTLTHYNRDGTRCTSSHGAVEDFKGLSEEFRTHAKAVYENFHPFEFDHTITEEERLAKMEEWWTTAHGLIVNAKLHRDMFKAMVKDANLFVRPKVDAMLDLLHKHGVPSLVFSAGIAEIVREALNQKCAGNKELMHVTSNEMVFSEEGFCIGFSGKNIHTMNKNEHALEGTPHFDRVKGRHAILLLGDNLGDLRMSEGIEKEVQITVGFLNNNVDARMDTYKAAFDVVVTGDGDYQPILDLLARLI